MIDWSRVDELRDEIGVEDFDEVVDLFLSEVEDRIDIMLSRPTHEGVEDDLHFLKGSALNLGFIQFAQLCAEGEQNTSRDQPFDHRAKVSSVYQTSKKLFLERLITDTAA